MTAVISLLLVNPATGSASGDLPLGTSLHPERRFARVPGFLLTHGPLHPATKRIDSDIETIVRYEAGLFRDWEIRYLVASVSLVWTFMITATVYETVYNVQQAPLEIATAILQWVGPAIGLTITILATWEVFLVFAQRYRERRDREAREEGRKEERARWEAWLKRHDEAIRNNLPFDEPNPAERDRG